MGGEGGGGGGKISHFRLNTSSEVFRDFQGFSEIFRDFQGLSEIFRDFQEFNVFWEKRGKKGMERGEGRRTQNIKFQVLKISGNP